MPTDGISDLNDEAAAKIQVVTSPMWTDGIPPCVLVTREEENSFLEAYINSGPAAGEEELLRFCLRLAEDGRTEG